MRRLVRGLAGRLRFLSPGNGLAAVAFQLRLDIVGDPFRVPPLDRQDRDAVEIDAEVKVVAGRKPRLAGLAEDLPLRHRVAVLYVDGTHVAVD